MPPGRCPPGPGAPRILGPRRPQLLGRMRLRDGAGRAARTAPGEAISEALGAPRRPGNLLVPVSVAALREGHAPTAPGGSPVSLLRTAAETVEGRGKIGNYCEKRGEENPNY